MQQNFSAVACFNSKKTLPLYINSFLLQVRRQCSIAGFQHPLEHLELLLFGAVKSLYAQNILPASSLAIKKELENKKERLMSQSLQGPAFHPGIPVWELCFGFRFPGRSPLRMLCSFLSSGTASIFL